MTKSGGKKKLTGFFRNPAVARIKEIIKANNNKRTLAELEDSAQRADATLGDSGTNRLKAPNLMPSASTEKVTY